MSTPLTVLLIAVALALVIAAAMLLRSGKRLPWPALGLSALTSAVCFTVGGATGADQSGPDLATVVAAVSGFLTVVAAIIALVPRDAERHPPSLVPIMIATVSVVIGAVGLVISLLTT